MRTIILCFFAAIMLTSCDNFKKKEKIDTTDEQTTPKKKKPLIDDQTDQETPKKTKQINEDAPDVKKKDNTDENTDQPQRKNTDYNTGWPTDDQSKFLDDCIATALKNVSQDRARQYCSCALEKIQKLFTSLDDANKHLTQTQLTAVQNECNQQ